MLLRCLDQFAEEQSLSNGALRARQIITITTNKVFPPASYGQSPRPQGGLKKRRGRSADSRVRANLIWSQERADTAVCAPILNPPGLDPLRNWIGSTSSFPSFPSVGFLRLHWRQAE